MLDLSRDVEEYFDVCILSGPYNDRKLGRTYCVDDDGEIRLIRENEIPRYTLCVMYNMDGLDRKHWSYFRLKEELESKYGRNNISEFTGIDTGDGDYVDAYHVEFDFYTNIVYGDYIELTQDIDLMQSGVETAIVIEEQQSEGEVVPPFKKIPSNVEYGLAGKLINSKQIF